MNRVKFQKENVYLLLFSLLCFSVCLGQEKFIVNEDTKEGIPYAVVTIDSTSYYADGDGKFKLIEGNKITINHIAFEKCSFILPYTSDTIFLKNKPNKIEEVVIGGKGELFKKGSIVKKTKAFSTNGVINGSIYKYFEVLKSFEFECSYYKINSLEYYLSDKNKHPFRINFYDSEKKPLHSLVNSEKQKKGLNEIVVDQNFDSQILYIGFEWLPNTEYEIVNAKIKNSKDDVSFTELSFGISKNINSENEYYRFGPNNNFIPFESNKGLILKLDCECFD